VSLLFCILCWVRLAGAADTVTIATEEFSPFTSETLKGNGIDCDIIRQALKVSGMEVQFMFVPAARSLKMAQDGEAVASLPWTKRPGREEDFLFSEPVIKKDCEVFFTLKGTPFDWDAASRKYERLKGKSVGAVIAYNYGDPFETAEKDRTIHVERVSTDKINFDKLFGKRVDAIIAKRMVGKFILDNLYTAEQRSQIVQFNENNDTQENDFLVVSKKNPEAEKVLKAVNAGIQELKRSGKYDEMIKAFESGKYFEKLESQEPQKKTSKDNEDGKR
jgi:polar amino acid transport system substrate-binding protein